MRKYLLYIVVLVLLLVLASIFLFSNSSGNLSIGSSSFSIENIDKIGEIRITEGKNQIILTKENEQWTVNNKFLVKEQIIENLLMVLNRIEIQYPVSKVEKVQIASLLKKDGIRVELKKNPFGKHQFLVSKPSMSKDKTYMMMVNSSEAFVTKISGFKSLVSQVFISDENYWRNKQIFNYLPQNINIISVEYPITPEKSFTLKNFNDGSFALLNYKNQPESNFNPENVARYFTYYQNIQFEDVLSDWSVEKKDSVLKSEPYINISVQDMNGVESNLKIFRKQADSGIDDFGEKTDFDMNRAYAMLNNNNELLLIQYYIFDPLLKEIDYFR